MSNLATFKANAAAARKSNRQEIANLAALVETTSQIVANASAKRAKATNQAKAPQLTAAERAQAQKDFDKIDRSYRVYAWVAAKGKFETASLLGKELSDLGILGTAHARKVLPAVQKARNAAAARLGILPV